MIDQDLSCLQNNPNCKSPRLQLFTLFPLPQKFKAKSPCWDVLLGCSFYCNSLNIISLLTSGFCLFLPALLRCNWLVSAFDKLPRFYWTSNICVGGRDNYDTLSPLRAHYGIERRYMHLSNPSTRLAVKTAHIGAECPGTCADGERNSTWGIWNLKWVWKNKAALPVRSHLLVLRRMCREF